MSQKLHKPIIISFEWTLNIARRRICQKSQFLVRTLSKRVRTWLSQSKTKYHTTSKVRQQYSVYYYDLQPFAKGDGLPQRKRKWSLKKEAKRNCKVKEQFLNFTFYSILNFSLNPNQKWNLAWHISIDSCLQSKIFALELLMQLYYSFWLSLFHKSLFNVLLCHNAHLFGV